MKSTPGMPRAFMECGWVSDSLSGPSGWALSNMLTFAWVVFSRCADYMEEGRRLENLSWRLWNRETFCVAPPNSKLCRSRLEQLRCVSKEIPELSSSVESAASDEGDGIETHIKCPQPRPVDFRPAILTEDSVLSISRGREKHITSLGLEKMVYNIKEKKSLEPIACAPADADADPETDATASSSSEEPQKQQKQKQKHPLVVDITPRPSSPTPAPQINVQSQPSPKQQQQQQQQQQQPRRPQPLPHQSLDSCSTVAGGNESENPTTSASDTSVSSNEIVKTSSIVRGFSPSRISSSYRSQPQLHSGPSAVKPMPPSRTTPNLKKKGGMFTLGGSSGDDDSSFEDRMANKPLRSSLSDGLQLPLPPRKQQPNFMMRNTSIPSTIKPIREAMLDDEDAIETDDEEISESAIEEDEGDSDWEDSITESGRSSVDEKVLFQRVDSRSNLVSRRSLLTMMMHQPQRTYCPPGKANSGHASRSTSALPRSRIVSPNREGPSDSDDNESGLTMKCSEVPHSKPIVMKSIPPQSIAQSPRTTRRNMLATELTESLRRHLLWERQQKTTNAAAAFQRRHTAHDMANLQVYPGPKGEQPQQPQQQQQQQLRTINNISQSRDKETSKNNSWNHYFDYGPWEYHVKGW